MTYYEELELDIEPGVSPSLTLTVFVSEGNTTLQQSATYEVEPCQEHRVTAAWSAGKLTPGSSVNLELSSDQDSLCGLSATDKVICIYMDNIRQNDLHSVSQSPWEQEQDFQREDRSTASQDWRKESLWKK